MKLILSSSPHAHAKNSVRSMMRDVIIALLPATGCSIWFFGMRSVWLIAVCIAASVVTESACRLMMRRDNSIGDLSAVLTGLLLALNLPPDLPLWMAVTGSVFAIAVAKQVFGGLGYNPFNPALSARAFMLISFTGAMTTWSNPVGCETVAGSASVDAVTCATPLAFIKKGDLSQLTSLKSFLFGNIGGCIGETCAVALLVGAAYLIMRRVITWHIPVSYLATAAVLTVPFYLTDAPLSWTLAQLCSGGLVMGALFMATDYTTSPVTPCGRLIYGALCGALTVLFRHVGIFPEGVTYAILLMNALVWIIDRFTPPKRFGTGKGGKEA